MNGVLLYNDFKDLYQGLIGESLTETDFNQQILTNFEQSEGGLTFHGLRQFIAFLYEEHGESGLRSFLLNLGYQEDFQNSISRMFALSIHSDYPISLQTCDSLKDLDLEFDSNELLIEKYGREIYKNGPLRIFCIFHE